MEHFPTGPGRTARLALVTSALLVLLAIVAYASRSGLGHHSSSTPSRGYVGYAFTAFLILFVLMIPVAFYALFLQAREGQAERKSFQSRVLANLFTFGVFCVAAYILWYMRHHHHNLFQNLDPSKLKKARAGATNHHPVTTSYTPKFEWTVVWIALVLGLAVTGVVYYRWRTRHLRTPVPLERDTSVADELAASINDAIDDLEAEPDARRAVIAAYARMEGVLSRNGLRRRPSETPVEYLRRILLGLTSRGNAVRRLTSLFEQAKFSRHDIDQTMKRDAIGALREIRDDLGGATT
jgi:hypothetical protein